MDFRLLCFAWCLELENSMDMTFLVYVMFVVYLRRRWDFFDERTKVISFKSSYYL